MRERTRVKQHRTAIVWFRRDLRVTDQPALLHAAASADHVLPVFVFDPEDKEPWRIGAASRWWLHHSLLALAAALQKRGSPLIVRRGEPLSELRTIVRECGATLLVWNRLFEPHERALEERVTEALGDDIECAAFNGALWFDPATLRNRQQQPYRVFTPFWRALEPELDRLPAPRSAPRSLRPPEQSPPSIAIEELGLLPRIRWYEGFSETRTPGEAGALKRLKRFVEECKGYERRRDELAVDGTSRLSAHLQFGELSPLQALAATRAHAPRNASASATAFLRELAWREFAHHLLYHYPHTIERCLDERFERMSWTHEGEALERWRRGRTGVPIVDAGMRELWRTGAMHNRVRMIVASYLTKNLQAHWLVGARWFWDTLVDASLANNTLNWQWVAGCGADASPYYRIFNPVLQTERFDPERTYIRRWVPELTRLPDAWIHQPWAAPAQVLTDAGVVLGGTYPKPLVDLAESRAAALAAYARIKSD